MEGGEAVGVILQKYTEITIKNISRVITQQGRRAGGASSEDM